MGPSLPSPFLWPASADTDTSSLSSAATSSDLAYLSALFLGENAPEPANPTSNTIPYPPPENTASCSHPCFRTSQTWYGAPDTGFPGTTASIPTTAAPFTPSPAPSRPSPLPLIPPAEPEDSMSPPIPSPKRKRGRPRMYPDAHTEINSPTQTPFPPSTAGTSTCNDHNNNHNNTNTTSTASPTSATTHPTAGASSAPITTEKRERNRAAAMRYRDRIRAQILDLEAETEEACSKRRLLSAQADELREELFLLKKEVLKHSDCDCPAIQGYLAGELQKTRAWLGCVGDSWAGSYFGDEGKGFGSGVTDGDGGEHEPEGEGYIC